jgi:topoisomerase-4 subunit A
MLHISSEVYPRFEIVFGGKDEERTPIMIDVDEFIGIKSCKAKGKRICTWEIASVNELEPTRYPEPVETEESEWEADGESGSEDLEQPAPNESEARQIPSQPAPTQSILPGSVTDNDDDESLIDEVTGQTSLF